MLSFFKKIFYGHLLQKNKNFIHKCNTLPTPNLKLFAVLHFSFLFILMILYFPVAPK